MCVCLSFSPIPSVCAPVYFCFIYLSYSSLLLLCYLCLYPMGMPPSVPRRVNRRSCNKADVRAPQGHRAPHSRELQVALHGRSVSVGTRASQLEDCIRCTQRVQSLSLMGHCRCFSHPPRIDFQSYQGGWRAAQRYTNVRVRVPRIQICQIISVNTPRLDALPRVLPLSALKAQQG